MNDFLKDLLTEHITVLQDFVEQNSSKLEQLSFNLTEKLRLNKKIFIAGNGGSASSSNHFTAELIGRFEKERKALAAYSLNSDMSTITAIANDYGYEHIFSRQIEALANGGDVLIAFSTSGKSPNIVKAMEQAKKQKMTVFLFTGEKGKDNTLANIVIDVPSTKTARIQECHDFTIHYLAKVIEDYFFNKQEDIS